MKSKKDKIKIALTVVTAVLSLTSAFLSLKKKKKYVDVTDNIFKETHKNF